MENKDTFSSYHPLVNFLYFGMVLAFTMFFMHPIYLFLSLFAAVVYSIYLRGRKAIRFSFFFLLPMVLAAALINPAFNHEGATILTYLPSGNPLTLESIIYGFSAALMLASVIIWFTCYNEVMTSDKFVYIFGRIAPALSLLLAMTLRFIPRLIAQIKEVSAAQAGLGRDFSEGSIIQRAKKGLTILSITLTWSLENAIETSDSMKSRGYGLAKRSAFSIYPFDNRDKEVLLWLTFCGIYILSGHLAGGLYWRYYPTLKGTDLSPFPLSFMVTYLALCLTPVIINLYEDWRFSKLTTQKAETYFE